MPNSLIIVESPTKAKTISRFLGSDYQIVSSYGHVRDLPKNKLGVDVEHNFEPQYIVPIKARKVVTGLTQEAAKAQTIYFATDEDREGEAISWHLIQLIKPADNKIKRIVFHEITKEAILEALQQPRKIDINLVNAQQARRVLDRLVGYELSPFLWKKIASGLSAGRVQSVAVRLIVEREKEIKDFKSQEYWSIEGNFTTNLNNKFIATLIKHQSKTFDKFAITNKTAAQELVKLLKTKSWQVASINHKDSRRTPSPPFTTSTLQQEANKRLGFSVKQTMMLAQRLYEGIELGNEGSVGLITYMRTDSVNLANKFLSETQNFIFKKWGKQYATGIRVYMTKSKMAQEAHEAIRPTDVKREPEIIQNFLDHKEFKLYQLIWQRAVSSQLPDAQIKTSTVDLIDNDQQEVFRASGQIITFDGWLKLSSNNKEESTLPNLTRGEKITLTKINPQQHFTEPPARYSEATLVKTLEEYGIGRPSTYAPTISTIIERGYVHKIQKRLVPTDLAVLVTDLLVKHFPEIVDYQFTAKIEDELDTIAEGHQDWVTTIKNFYQPFKKHLQVKEVEVTKKEVTRERILGKHPDNGKVIKVRIGRYGPYLQLGEAKTEGVKPKFVALPKNLSADTITLEQALALLSLPKILGQDDKGNEITIGIGRFGPYVKCNNEFRSLTPEDDLLTITLERALDLLKNQTPKRGIVKSLGKDPNTGNEIAVKNGHFGLYVTNGIINASLPKNIDPKTIALEQALELLAKKKKK